MTTLFLIVLGSILVYLSSSAVPAFKNVSPFAAVVLFFGHLFAVTGLMQLDIASWPAVSFSLFVAFVAALIGSLINFHIVFRIVKLLNNEKNIVR